jgi:hypothetical protein
VWLGGEQPVARCYIVLVSYSGVVFLQEPCDYCYRDFHLYYVIHISKYRH